MCLTNCVHAVVFPMVHLVDTSAGNTHHNLYWRVWQRSYGIRDELMDLGQPNKTVAAGDWCIQACNTVIALINKAVISSAETVQRRERLWKKIYHQLVQSIVRTSYETASKWLIFLMLSYSFGMWLQIIYSLHGFILHILVWGRYSFCFLKLCLIMCCFAFREYKWSILQSND